MQTQPAPVEELVERILSEGALGFGTIAKLCGRFRGDAPTSPVTVARWHQRGEF